MCHPDTSRAFRKSPAGLGRTPKQMCMLAGSAVLGALFALRWASGRPAAASRGSLFERRAFLESTHMCVVETRQPGSATVEACCVGCLVVTCAAPGACLAWMIKRTHASENPALLLTPSRTSVLQNPVLAGSAVLSDHVCAATTHVCLDTHVCLLQMPGNWVSAAAQGSHLRQPYSLAWSG